MTANRVGAGGQPATAGGGSSGPGLSGDAILDLCDGLLGEIGRRMHRFSWLRDPSAPIVSYLPLDSYYPGNRLIVVFGPTTVEQEQLCREQIPSHGFHLLWIVPDDLGGDPRIAADMLLERIRSLGPLPERPVERVTRREINPTVPASTTPKRATPPGEWTETTVYDGTGGGDRSATPETGPGFGLGSPAPGSGSHAPGSHAASGSHARTQHGSPHSASAAQSYTRQHPPRHGTREEQERAGIFFGIALAVVLGLEAFVLVIAFALQGGHVTLALGLALDVCARGLGTVAAVRDGSDDSAWGCLVFGSPAVVSFALLGDEPVATEPAPLAGGLGALSCVLIVLWILGRIVGL